VHVDPGVVSSGRAKAARARRREWRQRRRLAVLAAGRNPERLPGSTSGTGFVAISESASGASSVFSARISAQGLLFETALPQRVLFFAEAAFAHVAG